MCLYNTIRVYYIYKERSLLIYFFRDRVCCEYCGRTLTQSQHSSSLVSPCGRLVFAAGPCGVVHVWNTDDGQGDIIVCLSKQQLPIQICSCIHPVYTLLYMFDGVCVDACMSTFLHNYHSIQVIKCSLIVKSFPLSPLCLRWSFIRMNKWWFSLLLVHTNLL